MRYKPIVFVVVCWTVTVILAQESVYNAPLGTRAAEENTTSANSSRLNLFDNSEGEAENEDNSQKDNYTFVALIDIVFTDGCKRTCTGAIIHDNVVITAAHCFTMIQNAFLLPELSMSFVVIGTKLMFETGYEQYLPIERVVTHPRFKGWTADLALVFTFANMMSDKPGKILRLATGISAAPVDSNITVLSWGKCKADLDDEEIEKPKKKKKKQVDPDQVYEVTKSLLESQEPDDIKPKKKKKKQVDPDQIYEVTKGLLESQEPDYTKPKKKKKKQVDPDQIYEVTKGLLESQEPDYTDEPTTHHKKKKRRDRRAWIREKSVQDKNIKRAKDYQVQYTLQQNIPGMNTAGQDDFQQPNVRAHEDDEVLDNPQQQVVREDKSRYIAPLNKKPADYARTVLTNLTNNNKKSIPYLEYIKDSNEDLTRNWDGKNIQTMKRFEQTVQRKRLVKNLYFNGPDGGGYNPIENHNNPMKQQRNYNTGQIHQNNNNQNRKPVRHNRRNLPKLQEFHRFQHFKNWRRQIGQQHNNLTVGMFDYVNVATCKKVVEKTLPPIYGITNKHEVLCYSSEEFYITNEDSGAPVVQADELVAITVGGVVSDGDHVAVGMKISCFCSWIADNLPNYGGDDIICCKDCCTDQQPVLYVKTKTPSPDHTPSENTTSPGGLHRLINDDDDESDNRKDEMYSSK